MLASLHNALLLTPLVCAELPPKVFALLVVCLFDTGLATCIAQQDCT